MWLQEGTEETDAGEEKKTEEQEEAEYGDALEEEEDIEQTERHMPPGPPPGMPPGGFISSRYYKLCQHAIKLLDKNIKIHNVDAGHPYLSSTLLPNLVVVWLLKKQ